MDERFAILTLLSAEKNESLTGRTLLQKKIYFLNEILGLDIDFRPYYYGPYSDAVANALDSLVAMGFVKEECETFPRADDKFGDQKRYQYSLTTDGKNVMEVFAEAGNEDDATRIVSLTKRMDESAQAHDYNSLSVAAKTHLIVKNKGKVSGEELEKEAQSLGWELPSNLVKNSIEFLKSMGLVETEPSTPSP